MSNETNAEFIQLIKKAAAGNIEATYVLFYFFQEKKFSHSELNDMYQYVKHLTQQNPHAIYLHALFYDYGFAVKKDVDMAFILMREAAAKGHIKAIYEVGRRFLYGMGVEKHVEKAFQWLKLAAESPNYVPEAMYELGYMYEQGEWVAIDLQQAREWYEKAAARGSRAAKTKLNKP